MGTEFRAGLPPVGVARAWPEGWELEGQHVEVRMAVIPPDTVLATVGDVLIDPGGPWRPVHPETREPVDWATLEPWNPSPTPLEMIASSEGWRVVARRVIAAASVPRLSVSDADPVQRIAQIFRPFPPSEALLSHHALLNGGCWEVRIAWESRYMFVAVCGDTLVWAWEDQRAQVPNPRRWEQLSTSILGEGRPVTPSHVRLPWSRLEHSDRADRNIVSAARQRLEAGSYVMVDGVLCGVPRSAVRQIRQQFQTAISAGDLNPSRHMVIGTHEVPLFRPFEEIDAGYVWAWGKYGGGRWSTELAHGNTFDDHLLRWHQGQVLHSVTADPGQTFIPLHPSQRDRRWRPVRQDGPAPWDVLEALLREHQQEGDEWRRVWALPGLREGRALLAASLATTLAGHPDLLAVAGVLLAGEVECPAAPIPPDLDVAWRGGPFGESVRAAAVGRNSRGFLSVQMAQGSGSVWSLGGDRVYNRLTNRLLIERVERMGEVLLAVAQARRPAAPASIWAALDLGPDTPGATTGPREPSVPWADLELAPEADPAGVLAAWRAGRASHAAQAEAIAARARGTATGEPAPTPTRFALLEPDEAADPRVALLEHRARAERQRHLEAELRLRAQTRATQKGVPAPRAGYAPPARRPPFAYEDASVAVSEQAVFWGALGRAFGEGN